MKKTMISWINSRSQKRVVVDNREMMRVNKSLQDPQDLQEERSQQLLLATRNFQMKI